MCRSDYARLLDELVEDVLLGSPFDAQALLNPRARRHAEVAGHGYDGVAVLGLFFQQRRPSRPLSAASLAAAVPARPMPITSTIAVSFSSAMSGRYRRRRQEDLACTSVGGTGRWAPAPASEPPQPQECSEVRSQPGRRLRRRPPWHPAPRTRGELKSSSISDVLPAPFPCMQDSLESHSTLSPAESGNLVPSLHAQPQVAGVVPATPFRPGRLCGGSAAPWTRFG